MASPDTEVYGALASAFGGLRARWYVFGAQAAIIHGAVRFTEDIDVTVELGETSTKTLLDALLRSGLALRVRDADEFVARTRVLPCLHEATGIPVDIVLAGPGLETLFLERATLVDIEGQPVPVACAEDLVVMKVLAGRPKDLEDIVAVLAAQREKLDVERVRETLRMVEQALDQRDLVPLFEQCVGCAPSDPSD